MGRLQSSIGLITGTPIQDTVNQLINLSAIPRDRLTARTASLTQQRSAVTDLTVLSIGVQLAAKTFGTATNFNRTKVATSSSDSLSATRSGTPDVGTYKVRTLQTAGTQAYRSQSFSSANKPFTSNGTLTVRGGGYVDRSANLADLNGGRGVEAGAIRITDRSGESQVIDLSNATSIQDVLDTINSSADINISASTDGDRIRLTDLTSGTESNLIVEDLGGGSTAADLGLRGINSSNAVATGADIQRLSEKTALSTLRDGRGLGFGTGDDLEVTFADGATLDLDFGDFSREASRSRGSTNSTAANAGLTFTAVEEGAAADGVRVRFVNDPSIVAGEETVQKIETPGGPELVFSINAGTTTAENIASALADNEALNAEFTAAAAGDGSGLVSVDDIANLAGGAAIEAVERPELGDLLRVLNEADPTRLRAELSPGGDSIRLIDLTSGSNQFSVVDKGSSTVAAELGLAQTTGDSTIGGKRLLSGLTSVSLDTLNGGKGLGTLGTVDITTADGTSAGIDLSSAETLQDVLNSLNDSSLNIEAQIDRTGAGIEIRDLTGGTTAEFSIDSADDTAAKLGIENSTTDAIIQGSSLEAQFISRATSLSDLNQGRGIGSGSFKITDSTNQSIAISLSTDPINTVGDLLDRINDSGLNVTASINETGDGIRLVDTGDGELDLTVEDSGAGESAKLLGLAGVAGQEVIDGNLESTLNGRQADVFRIRSGDTLSSLVADIRANGRFSSASLLGNPGGGAAFSLTSLRGGDAGRVSISNSGINLGLQQSNRGRDAVIAIGGGDGGTATIFRSADGVFADAVNGVTITAKEISDEPVDVTISEDRAGVESSIQRFVDQYNRLIDRVGELTSFNAETNEVGIMFGRGETLRIQNSLARTMTARMATGSSIRTAADVGLRLNAEGQLDFNTEKLSAAIERDPAAVETFFTTEEFGFAAKIDQVVERIAGADNGSLINRQLALNTQIDRNNERVEFMNERLESERERLLKQFNDMESSIARLQTNQQYISSISFIGNFNSDN